MRRIKVILKKKNVRASMLDHLDNTLERERILKGKYPTHIKLSFKSLQKMYKEIKEKGLTRCWVDWKNNYRGIPIILIK